MGHRRVRIGKSGKPSSAVFGRFLQKIFSTQGQIRELQTTLPPSAELSIKGNFIRVYKKNGVLAAGLRGLKFPDLGGPRENRKKGPITRLSSRHRVTDEGDVGHDLAFRQAQKLPQRVVEEACNTADAGIETHTRQIDLVTEKAGVQVKITIGTGPPTGGLRLSVEQCKSPQPPHLPPDPAQGNTPAAIDDDPPPF